MERTLRWGLLGAGMIADRLAQTLKATPTGSLYAVASRRPGQAEALLKQHGGERAYTDYDALLADPNVDAVYVSPMHPEHAKWTIRSAEAGKAILCEKPAAMNRSEVDAMLEACRRHRVFFMEAFMWRTHPGTARLVELIKAGAIGQVKLIHANFAFNLHGNPTSTRMRADTGGGGILDVGCYTMSAARLVAGAAMGQHVAEPLDLTGYAHLGSTGVDEWAVASCRFPQDMLAQLSTGVQVNMGPESLAIFGERGRINVPSPWFADGRIELFVEGQEPQVITVSDGRNAYVCEVEMVARCVREGRLEAYEPCMTWDDTRGQASALDRWRRAVGLTYPIDRPDAPHPTVHGRALRRRDDADMSYGKLAGLSKPVSRAVMGTMCFTEADMAYTSSLADDAFERGINTFDTANIYGADREKGIGRWIENRGIREQVVILGKGAHSGRGPETGREIGCTPENLLRQLHQSLENMRTDYVDIYCMHRDNPQVPAGEFVDVMDQLASEGKMRLFGGSNWSTQRIDEANAYAQKHGKRPMSVLSNNFSLAVWNEPMWGGCMTCSDPASRQWLIRTKTPLLAWSAQASGLFTGRFKPSDRATLGEGHDVVRTWFNDANFERLRRAQELGQQLGCDATQIALAWVLNQPFDVYALIGPRTIDETRTSLQGMNLKLTPAQLAWLNLEA